MRKSVTIAECWTPQNNHDTFPQYTCILIVLLLLLIHGGNLVVISTMYGAPIFCIFPPTTGTEILLTNYKVLIWFSKYNYKYCNINNVKLPSQQRFEHTYQHPSCVTSY